MRTVTPDDDFVTLDDASPGEEIPNWGAYPKDAFRAVDVSMHNLTRLEGNRQLTGGSLILVLAADRIGGEELERQINVVVPDVATGDDNRPRVSRRSTG